jgi:hypothetical protein
MNDKDKMLRLMRYWLVGTFIIIYAAATIYVGGALGTGLAILGELNYWLAILITAVLSFGAYYLYKWYLERS